MKEKIITEVIQGMLPCLNNGQLIELQRVLTNALNNKQVIECEENNAQAEDNQKLIDLFVAAKRVEGCSEKSITYYSKTIGMMLNTIRKDIRTIVTDDLREYLTNYQAEKHSSKVTIDNIRRIFSSFFSWLEDEDYIIKSPVRRIHKVKATISIKEIYTDESLELMRDNCITIRDLALVDFLASTGMRVGELVLLNREDIDFQERECIVLGKGDKQRPVYFDARAKIHLQQYLESRTDDNPALFVSLKAPYCRLNIGGVEVRIRELGLDILGDTNAIININAISKFNI